MLKIIKSNKAPAEKGNNFNNYSFLNINPNQNLILIK